MRIQTVNFDFDKGTMNTPTFFAKDINSSFLVFQLKNHDEEIEGDLMIFFELNGRTFQEALIKRKNKSGLDELIVRVPNGALRFAGTGKIQLKYMSEKELCSSAIMTYKINDTLPIDFIDEDTEQYAMFQQIKAEWEAIKGQIGTGNGGGDSNVDLSNYYTKSETEELIANIELIPGPAGKDGKPGLKGDKGDSGLNGADGYTPVKGVDYFDGVNGADGEVDYSYVDNKIEEVFTHVVNGKGLIETAIIDKGGTVSKIENVPTFGELAQAIETLPEGGGAVDTPRLDWITEEYDDHIDYPDTFSFEIDDELFFNQPLAPDVKSQFMIDTSIADSLNVDVGIDSFGACEINVSTPTFEAIETFTIDDFAGKHTLQITEAQKAYPYVIWEIKTKTEIGPLDYKLAANNPIMLARHVNNTKNENCNNLLKVQYENSINANTKAFFKGNSSMLSLREIVIKGDVTLSDYDVLNNLHSLKRIIADQIIVGQYYGSDMFKSNYSLEELPDRIDTSACTSLLNAFANCYSLRKIPDLNTSSCTSLNYFANYCYSLIYPPKFSDTSQIEGYKQAFANCFSMVKFPEMNTENATAIDEIFDKCYRLRGKKMPVYNLNKVINLGPQFEGILYPKKYWSKLNEIDRVSSERYTIINSIEEVTYKGLKIEATQKYKNEGQIFIRGLKVKSDGTDRVISGSAPAVINLNTKFYGKFDIDLSNIIARPNGSAYSWNDDQSTLCFPHHKKGEPVFYVDLSQCTDNLNFSIYGNAQSTKWYQYIDLRKHMKLESNKYNFENLKFLKGIKMMDSQNLDSYQLSGSSPQIKFNGCNMLNLDAIEEIIEWLPDLNEKGWGGKVIDFRYTPLVYNTYFKNRLVPRATAKGWTVTV